MLYEAHFSKRFSIRSGSVATITLIGSQLPTCVVRPQLLLDSIFITRPVPFFNRYKFALRRNRTLSPEGNMLYEAHFSKRFSIRSGSVATITLIGSQLPTCVVRPQLLLDSIFITRPVPFFNRYKFALRRNRTLSPEGNMLYEAHFSKRFDNTFRQSIETFIIHHKK